MYLNFVWFVVVVGFKSLRFKLGLVNFLKFSFIVVFYTDAHSRSSSLSPSLTLAPAQAADACVCVRAAPSQ